MLSRLDYKLKTFAALTIVILVLLAVLPWLSSRDANEAMELLKQVVAKEQAYNEVLSLLKDAETGQRGFLLSSDESFLEPYDAGVAGITRALDDVAKLASTPAERAMVAKVSDIAQAKFREMHGTIVLKRAGKTQEAIDTVASRRGKFLMDELREIIGKELRTLSHRRTALRDQIASTLMYNAGLGITASFISLLLVFLSMGMSARSLSDGSQAAARAENLARSNALYAEQSARRADRLSVTAQMLQALDSVGTPAELDKVLTVFLRKLLPETSGAIYLYRNSRDVLELQAIWGEADGFENTVHPDDCWGLRLGKVHRATKGHDLCCEHGRARTSTQITQVCVPMISQGNVIGLMVITTDIEGSAALDGDTVFSIAEQLSLAISNVTLRDSLKRQSTVDALTGLYNRGYFDESLNRELARAKRAKSSCALIMFDLDHFKRINDTHGHDAGDLVLKETAAQLRGRLREGEIACRYGGEEMALLLQNCTAADAAKCAEGIRQALNDMIVSYLGRRLQVSASFGVAAWPETGPGSSDLVKAADRALYTAKNAGRNRVFIAEPSNPDTIMPSKNT